MAKTYSEKLKDPRWQKVRSLIMIRDRFMCIKCNSTTITLNVHHIKYLKGYEPWQYPAEMLQTLCEICHAKEHGISKEEVYERKYEHLIDKKETPEVIIIIDNHIESLHKKLKEDIEDTLMDEILMNIMFLSNKKKELQGD